MKISWLPAARNAACAISLLSLFATPAAAQTTGGTAGFASRIDVRNEYRRLQGGGSVDFVVPRLDLALQPDLGLRVEVPMVYADPDVPGQGSGLGLGDVALRASYRMLARDGWALVGGSDLVLDTAGHDVLGDGKNVLAPFLSASIDLPGVNSVFFSFLQHGFTLGGDGGRPDVRYTSFRPVLLTRWQDGLYTIVEPNLIVDHVRADRVGATLEVEAGRFVNRSLAVWARPGFGLHGDNLPAVYDWSIQLGLRWFLD